MNVVELTTLIETLTDEAILDSLTTVPLDDLADFLAGLAYNGFDPKVVFAELMKRAKDLKLNVKQFATEMQKLMAFYTIRGTNYNRPDFKDRTVTFSTITETKRIASDFGLLRSAKKKDDITIQRVAAVLPHYAIRVFVMANQFKFGKVVGLPDVFHHPQAPAIMTPNEYASHLENWITFMYNMNLAINRKGKVENDIQRDVVTDRTIFDPSQRSIADQMHNNKYSTEHRVKWRAYLSLNADQP